MTLNSPVLDLPLAEVDLVPRTVGRLSRLGTTRADKLSPLVAPFAARLATLAYARGKVDFFSYDHPMNRSHMGTDKEWSRAAMRLVRKRTPALSYIRLHLPDCRDVDSFA